MHSSETSNNLFLEEAFFSIVKKNQSPNLIEKNRFTWKVQKIILSWYDIPELVFAIRKFLIDGICSVPRT